MRNEIKFDRRNFIRIITSISLLPLLKACKLDNLIKPEPSPAKPKVDLMLEGNNDEIAEKIRNQYENIKSIWEQQGKEFKIGFEYGNGYGVLRLSFVKDDLASYPHLRIVNDLTGDRANILWGMDGIYPSIKFVDDSGKTIVKNGYVLEFPLKLTGTGRRISSTSSARDWLMIGIKVFAIAFMIWLGLSIGKFIISAIAFVAFNAMVIGLVLVALSVVIPLVKWILDVTGITLDDVISLFKETVDMLISILLSVVDYLKDYFGR